MKIKTLILLLFLVLACTAKAQVNYKQALEDTLSALQHRTDNDLLKIHFGSMLELLQSVPENTAENDSLVRNLYEAINDSAQGLKSFASYQTRTYPLILAWQSPTDGVVSFSWLKLPYEWSPEKTYPLYVSLHGNWDVANNKLDFLSWPYRQTPGNSYAFENGYSLTPWGRGNASAFRDIGETDVLEGIEKLQTFASIDPMRRYLSGHSNGGAGAIWMGSRSPYQWTALGLRAAAITNDLMTTDIFMSLQGMPVYFVCGTNDGYLERNQQFRDSLESYGNYNTTFVTFEGGHESRQVDAEHLYLWFKILYGNNFLSRPTVKNGKTFAFPNPFSTSTQISYTLIKKQEVNIEVYNQYGQKVTTLLNDVQEKGVHEINWVPQNLPAGWYSYCIRTGQSKVYGKLLHY